MSDRPNAIRPRLPPYAFRFTFHVSRFTFHASRFRRHLSRLTSRLSLFPLFSSFFFLLAFGTTAGYPQVAGTSVPERAEFARQGEALAPFIRIIAPLPGGLETLPGYVQWRLYGGLPIFLAGWALFSATAAIRGQEGRGILEQQLAAGVSRRRWVAQRTAAFLGRAGIAVFLSALGVIAGSLVVGEPVDPAGLVGVSVAAWALALCCFGLVLVAGELAATRRQAIGFGLVALGTLFGFNSLARGDPGSPLVLVTPFAWYERTDSLRPGGAFDLPATLALGLVGLGLIGLTDRLFSGRDLGAPALRRAGESRSPSVLPATNRAWRHPITAALYQDRLLIASFLIAAGALAVMLALLAQPLGDLLRTLPTTRSSARLLAGDPVRTLLGYFLFGTLQLLIAVYAVVHVGEWVDEQTSGRIGARLAAPFARSRITGDRAVVSFIGTTLLAIVSTIAAGIAVARQGVDLDPGLLALASIGLVPFGLCVGGVGAWLSVTLPRAAVALTGGFVAVSFLLLEIGTIFGWPNWLLNLSVFQLYGNPLADGPNWPGLLALTLIGLTGFLAADHHLRSADLSG